MIFSFFLISFIASTVGAISGIGGGVIIKPSLDTFSSLSVANISFLSGCTVLSMTIVTLIRSRGGEVSLNRRISSLLALGGIAGGMAGKYLFDQALESFSSPSTVSLVQSSLLALMVALVFLFILNKERIVPKEYSSGFLALLTGFLLGVIASFLGIGGGPINIALLYLFFSMDAKKAALNSIFIIFLSQSASLLFTLATDRVPDFDIRILLLMMAGGILGGFAGSFVTKRVSLRGVDTIFLAVLFLIFVLSGTQIFRILL
ncbi:MAG: sulfite exporter TauE/SafE family protein [Sphaerochaetaceae bacterium]|nr:sulfite exporter TauE/SafE family protein [Sphaerochaetaceae bacterium]